MNVLQRKNIFQFAITVLALFYVLLNKIVTFCREIQCER